MPEPIQWEYRATSAGTFWNMPSDEDLEALLNEMSEEGWEVIGVFSQHGSNKVRVVAKRPLTSAARRQRSWPTEP